MEKKLYFYIMYPAMLLSWIFGLGLIHLVGAELISALWMQVKFFLVVILTAYHFYLGSCLKAFSLDRNTLSSRYFRIINEIPTILLILIISTYFTLYWMKKELIIFVHNCLWIYIHYFLRSLLLCVYSPFSMMEIWKDLWNILYV